MYHWCVGQDGHSSVHDSAGDSFNDTIPQAISDNDNDDSENIDISPNESIKYQEKSLDGKEHIRPLKTYRTANPKSLIIGHININSVRYKCIEMSDYLSENLLDVLFIAETKLDASFPSPQFHVDGFKLHRSDRNEHGGGIMAYVRMTSPIVVVPTLKML